MPGLHRTDAWSALTAARDRRHEDPAGALEDAIRCGRTADELSDAALRGRALALQGMVTLHRGDLRGAFALAAGASRGAQASEDATALVEAAGLEAHLSFFSGAYAEALRHVEEMLARVAEADDDALRLYAHRCSCLVLGNLDVPEWPQRLDEVLRLAIDAGNRWEEAVCRNDRAHRLMETGLLPEAEREALRGIALAEALAPGNRFALGLLRCTLAEIRLRAGDADGALQDATAAVALLSAQDPPNPFLLGMSGRVQVQALLAGGRPDEAQACGREAIARLDESLPQVRGMILREVADALRAAGHSDEAFDALRESAELERIAYRELSALQRDLDRARVDAESARREAARLRDEADRDPLTGLHNRRYLARLRQREQSPGPWSIAIVDLDHFKSINDRFGHHAGDEVLVRTAALLLDVVRTTDVVVRAGGEEFVVVMPDTDRDDAAACAERVRRVIADAAWAEVAPGLSVTASVGVASSESSALSALAKVADRRLYAAKKAGRNLVVAGELEAA